MIADRIASSISRLFVKNASIENPSVAIGDSDIWGGGSVSEAGLSVTPYNSLRLAPVWQAVSTISGDVAGVSLHVYKSDVDGGREVDRSHPAEFTVNRRANAETSAFAFWRRIMLHALLWGNGYAYIRRTGRQIELINLLPDRTMVDRDDNGDLLYWTEVNMGPASELMPLPPSNVFHLQGLSIENNRGCHLVNYARDAWGLALAAESWSSRFFRNGANAGGVLEIPASMTARAADNLEEGFRKKTGQDAWFRTVILRDGAKFHSMTIDAEKSQLHDLREDEVRDVCRFFNLPPFKLGISDSLSYNSQEQAQLTYLTGTLWHWLRSIQAESDMKLLSSAELLSGNRSFDHDAKDVAKPDYKSLNETLQVQRQNEIISANEWRREIGMKPRTDPGGDEYVNPNVRPKTSGGDASNAMAASLHALLDNASRKFARRVGHQLNDMANHPAKICKWVDENAVAIFDAFDVHLAPVVRTVSTWIGQAESATIASIRGDVQVFFTDRVEQIIDNCTQDDLPHMIAAFVGEVESQVSERVCSLLLPEVSDVHSVQN